MSDNLKTTVKIQRPAKIQSDERGRSVWAEPVETAELELMSTTALKVILESEGQAARESIEAVARRGDEGVLARDTATGHFEIIDDADLQAILDNDFSLPEREKAADVTYEPAAEDQSIDDLSLVSTQALRKILGQEDEEKTAPADRKESGFDPYNSG